MPRAGPARNDLVAMEPQPQPLATSLRCTDRERLLLSLLLWAVSHGQDRRRDPMARLHLAVLLPAGAFVYDPRAHALRANRAQDLRVARGPGEPPEGFDLACVARGDPVDPGRQRAVAALDAGIMGARLESFCSQRGLRLLHRGPQDARAVEAGLDLPPSRFVSSVLSIAWQGEVPRAALSVPPPTA